MTEKISLVQRRLGRRRAVETSALLRARKRIDEQCVVYPLTEASDLEPEIASSRKAALFPGIEDRAGSVLSVFSTTEHEDEQEDEQEDEREDEQEADADITLELEQLEELEDVLPLEEMEVGESKEIPVVVTKTSALKVGFKFEEGESLLTTEDVCRLLGVSKHFLYRKIHEGRVPCLQIGRRYRFPQKGDDWRR